jgi:hypothetical protein
MSLGKFLTVGGIVFVLGRLAWRLYQEREQIFQAHGPLGVAKAVEPALKEAAHGI